MENVAAARRMLRSLVILFIAPVCAHAQLSALDLSDKTVTAVRVFVEERGTVEENPAHLPLQPGQPYRSATVRESIRELYRSGKYDDIEALAFPEPGGVRVEFRVRENYYIDVVRVNGLRSPQNEALALASLRLRVGEPFQESGLREALARLREALQTMGFYEADIRTQRVPHLSTRQMDVLVHVEAGPRATIGPIDVRALDARPVNDLARRSKLKSGGRLRTGTLDRAAERIRNYLVKKGHYGARVSARRGEYDPASRAVPVTLEVYTGPTLAVRVEGAKISEGTLKKLVPVYQEGAVDEDLLQEGRRNIRDHLESQGYFDSDVRYSVSEDGDDSRQVVTYTVVPGPRRRLVGFAFEGNQYFSRELLAERLRVKIAATFSRGRFSRRILQDDVESISALYVSNGFPNVEVKPEIIEDYQGEEGGLFLKFHVSEGPQTKVAELKIEGNAALSTDYLESYVGSTRNQPYSEFNVLSDRNNILAIYFNEGFPEARFEYSKEDGPGPNQVRLTYRITEGPQVTVKSILYSGMEHTHEGTIRRQMRIEPGEPLRQGELIESQRNLYNLGIFSRVQIAPQNPEGRDTEKTLVVNVEEARRYTIAYGGGFEVQRLGGSPTDPVASDYEVSPRGLLEFSMANVGGRANTLSFRARASSIQYLFLGSLAAPNFLGKPALRLEIGGFAEKVSDVKTFTAKKYEGSVGLVHRVTDFTTMGYRYFYRRVLVDPDSLRVDPLSIPLLSQPTKFSGFGAAWVRDRRDPPAEARRGNFNSIDANFAVSQLGSTGDFVRLFAQNSTFHPYGSLVFARSLRFGVIVRHSGTQVFDVPLPERIFGGGGNSIRGFGLNQAGPRTTTGFPIGGEGMLLLNQELRFPMRLPFVRGQVGGALFYDGGNVFSEIGNITFRANPKPLALGLDDFFSHTIGFSFRYSTPIGPVRLDFAYLLNNVQFQFLDSANAVQSRKLPRFQFFFNIGSMF
jgi:outer membrane protein assembly complex protein YaeT